MDEIDPDTGFDYEIFGEYLSEVVSRWAESRKNELQSIGEDRAVTELAFRDAIVSEKSEKIGKSEKWFWVTVNPIKGTKLSDIVRCVSKMYQKKWIEQYAYVYENTVDGHIHSHGLIKATYEAARARKELANSVSKICNVSNTHCFKFVILDQEKAKQKMSYILGYKQSKKLPNVELTKLWREQEMLKEIYENEERPILLVPRERETSLDNVAEIPLPDIQPPKGT